MEYYFSKTINDSFENAIEKAQLKVFGVLTEIDLKQKKKLDVDFTITPFWEPAILTKLLAG
jgi:hypothetical protein